MKHLAIAVAVLVASGAFGQAAQAPPKEPAAQPPAVSAELQVKILKLQRDMSGEANQANQLQQEITSLQNQYNANSKQVTELIEEAFKDAKLSHDDYTFDYNTLTFTAIPKPAPATPASATPPAAK